MIVAAPHSGSGKTLVTLGLIRALRNARLRVASAKVGPDYIDPQFHSAASGSPCLNLDYWAMGPDQCKHLLNELGKASDIVIIEGVMGLFDGPDGVKGSTADLATALGLPVLLVIDCSHQAQSIAALVAGFAAFSHNVNIAGVFLNRTKSPRHSQILRNALSEIAMPVIGELRHDDSLHMPSRHLGLVQAHENQQLDEFIESAARGVARETKLDNVVNLSTEFSNQLHSQFKSLPPLAQNIALARDEAFAFAYPHQLKFWREAGATLSFFSPLADEIPDPSAQAIFLPGGYPELHAGRISGNTAFLQNLRQFSGLIYGECGGYMVMGAGLVDAHGHRHEMAGLLPLETSFEKRKLHLGYRQLTCTAGPFPAKLRGHEFHYATILSEGDGERLFVAENAAGEPLPPMGLRRGLVMGSFAHIISVQP